MKLAWFRVDKSLSFVLSVLLSCSWFDIWLRSDTTKNFYDMLIEVVDV